MALRLCVARQISHRHSLFRPAIDRLLPAEAKDRRGTKPAGKREQFFKDRQLRSQAEFDERFALTPAPPTGLIDADDRAAHLSSIPYPREIVRYLDEYVIGQENAKRNLAVGVYQHYKRVKYNIDSEEKALLRECFEDWLKKKDTLKDGRQVIIRSDIKPSIEKPGFSFNNKKNDTVLEKSNIVLLGPSGSGKTYLTTKLADALHVPIAMCDCTTLTQAGYVGEDVDSVIQKLLINADGDVSAAEQGIVFLDEFDKIYTSADPLHTAGNRDVNGKGVQQALLKMVEGTRVRVKMDNIKVDVDTSNILFVASGAFSNLERIVARRLDQRTLGFNAKSSNFLEHLDERDERLAAEVKTKLLQQADQGDLIEFGMVPELVGRFPVMVTFESLTEELLQRVLTEPRNNLISQAQTLFGLDELNLEFTDCALSEMASMAVKRKTGARALRSIIEKTLLSAKYECPGTSKGATILISGAVVRGDEPYRRILPQ